MNLYAVRVFVQNWEQACNFYRDVLGLPERFRNDAVGWAEYDLGGPCFGIERIDPAEAGSQEMLGRNLGISLRVDDINGTYENLRVRGVKFIAPPEQQGWGGYLAHFEDPEGNVLTLLG